MINRTLIVLAPGQAPETAEADWERGESFDSHGHGTVNRESAVELRPALVLLRCGRELERAVPIPFLE